MNRIDCFKVMAELAGDALVVTGAGGNTVEWYACRPGDGNFRVRTMGLVSSIALGMALGLPHRQVVAIDGDGSLLMNLCSLPTIARKNPPNLTHVVLDNEVYEASRGDRYRHRRGYGSRGHGAGGGDPPGFVGQESG